MTTFERLRLPSFEDGLNRPLYEPTILFPTATAKDTERSPESYMQMKRSMQGGERRTISALSTAVQAGSISLPEDIPANHLASPGGDWARRMTAISGQQLQHWLPTSGRLAACLRTLLGMSRWDSMLCWLIWSQSATPARRLLFRLRAWEPGIAATASGFLPTPSLPSGGNTGELIPNKNHFLRKSGKKEHLGLDQAVKLLPTATANSGNGEGMHGEGSLNLQTVVSLLPTPTVNDAKSLTAPSQMERNSLPLSAAVRMMPTPRAEGFDARSHCGKPDSLHALMKLMPTPQATDPRTAYTSEGYGPNLSEAVGQKPRSKLRLSAAWVTRFMGYPDDWLLDLPPDPIIDSAAMTPDQRAKVAAHDLLVMDGNRHP